MVDKLRKRLHRVKNFVFSLLDFDTAPNAPEPADSVPSNTAEAATDASMRSLAAEQAATPLRRSESSLKRPSPHNEDDGRGEWQTVTRPRKKSKKIPQPGKSYPSLNFSTSARLQSAVNLNQLRDLVTYIFADGTGPQWIAVSHRPQFRKIVTIMVPGLEAAMFKNGVDLDTYDEARSDEDPSSTSPDDYYPHVLRKESIPEVLQPFAEIFPHIWPIRTPGDDRHAKMHSPMTVFLTSPLPKEKTSKPGSVRPVTEPRGWKNERTRIIKFLATADELSENGFVVHPAMLPKANREQAVLPDGWVMTRINDLEDGEVPESEIEAGSVTAGRDVFALDCEMCMTGENEFSLTRISIVDWVGDVVLDELVKPDKPITDYVTRFSGITEEMLAPVSTTLADIQEKLLKILHPRSILVGHSLESDFKALFLTHPFIVDTSLLFPHPRGPPIKSSLKYLAQKYLSRDIQSGGASGHDSTEDARTCLDLVKQKCEKGQHWGSNDAQSENLFRRLARAGTAYKAQGGDAALGGFEVGKTSAAVDWGDPSRGLGAGATYQLACQSDDEVVTNVLRAVQGDAAGEVIKGSGVDFVWARMRELEALRGWWNNNRTENSNSDHPPAASPGKEADKSPLEAALSRLTQRLTRIHAALPPCTALILYSGSGDPREMARLQLLHAQWRREYNTLGKKWDELSVQWTDVEDQRLRRAVQKARMGVGFLSVK